VYRLLCGVLQPLCRLGLLRRILLPGLRMHEPGNVSD
jgi:hypothetical protein